MPREPKPFVFDLTDAEIAEITEATAGEGGQQELRHQLTDQLASSGNQVTLNDADLGKLIRYMTQYGGGGFQGNLRRAFTRALLEQLGVKGTLL
jgi:hypothetical protein